MEQVVTDRVTPPAEGVHGRLREMLLTGELRAGAALKEIELSERLGVSRTPLREALHRLEVEGVVVKQGRSYTVAVVDDETSGHLTEARTALEPAVAELAAASVAAGQVAPVDLVHLDQTVADLASAAEAADGAAAAVANHAFHLAVAELSGNPVMATMATQLNDRLAIASLARLGSPTWAATAATQHRRIAEAIAAGDPAAARQAAAEHVGDVGREAAT